MSVNTSKVITRMEFYAPEHASKSTAIKEQAVEAAVSQRINVSLWTKHGKLIDGAAYLAAHLLTKRDQKNGPLGSSSVQGQGPVERITEGEITIEWGDLFQTQGDSGNIDVGLADTDYGQAFMDLKDSLLSTPLTSG